PDGGHVILPDQPFRILAVLIKARGALVTREDLRRELWPENTFVDFEHSLNAGVKRLRESIGDSATAPRFIETIPRRGYRFIAPVDMVVAGPAAAEAESPITPAVPPPMEHRAEPGRRDHRWIWLAGPIVAIAAGASWLATTAKPHSIL